MHCTGIQIGPQMLQIICLSFHRKLGCRTQEFLIFAKLAIIDKAQVSCLKVASPYYFLCSTILFGCIQMLAPCLAFDLSVRVGGGLNADPSKCPKMWCFTFKLFHSRIEPAILVGREIPRMRTYA